MRRSMPQYIGFLYLDVIFHDMFYFYKAYVQ